MRIKPFMNIFLLLALGFLSHAHAEVCKNKASTWGVLDSGTPNYHKFKTLEVILPKGARIQTNKEGDPQIYAHMDKASCEFLKGKECQAGWAKIQSLDITPQENGTKKIAMRFDNWKGSPPRSIAMHVCYTLQSRNPAL